MQEADERRAAGDVEMQVDGSNDDVGTPEGDAEDPAMDVDDDEGTDATVKHEESAFQRQEAIDSLGMVEHQFTSFKDKLYDERLQQLSDELALLSQPQTTRPEHRAMLQCIDVRRDEKIRHEQRMFRYRFEAMQRRFVAERSQIHNQYFQTVRAIREKILEEAGERWHRIQHDRRQWETDVDEYLHRFQTRRSAQIREQRAYNTEVSVLSGVAKYVGFPAAPCLNGAESGTLQDDLRRMRLLT